MTEMKDVGMISVSASLFFKRIDALDVGFRATDVMLRSD
jgi:hypothetical protein